MGVTIKRLLYNHITNVYLFTWCFGDGVFAKDNETHNILETHFDLCPFISYEKMDLCMGIVKLKEKEDKHIMYSNRHKISSVTRTDILIQYTFQGLAQVWCNFLHYYNNNWWLHIWLSAQHMSIWRLQFNSGNGFRFKILKLPRECYSSFFKHRHLEFISCQKL